MKKLFTLMAAALICFAASAVPAKPGTHTFTQSDGSTITVKMVGDEFHHSFMTLDNLTVDLDENGDVTPNSVAQPRQVLSPKTLRRSLCRRLFPPTTTVVAPARTPVAAHRCLSWALRTFPSSW